MIRRNITPVVLEESRSFPVVTLTGPRQSGKTTLVRNLFSRHKYVNLENPETRSLATEDPRSFFKLHKPPLVLDEIQRVPELMSWIQVMVDEGLPNGSFILTGSHQLMLHSAVTQSLAGRTSLLTLLPLSLSELRAYGITLDKDACMLRGFLPRIHGKDAPATSTYRTYFQTYVERDVRLLINIRNMVQFETFMRILAGRVGQVINLNNMADDVGVSGTTLSEWLSILEASYIIFRLPPYFKNFGKRLIKSPKLYFTEPGLAAWLLGIETEEQIMRDPLHGQLFENMVITDRLKSRYNSGKEPNLYFWRDNNGNEVDLISDEQRALYPFEIKSARTWNKNFLKGIKHFQKHIPVAREGTVIYGGDKYLEFEKNRAVPFDYPEI